jgi:predicted deacylase
MTNQISCGPDDLDFDRRGVSRYTVRIDYRWQGTDSSLDFPVVVFRNGKGPCALLIGGTHGDEFEGQMTATRLAGRIQPEDVHGTLIVVPTHNRPAALAGQRCSPIDGADLNRLYPGGAGEGPSRAIARFMTERLIAPADLVVDIHSGGNTHEFVLSSNLQGRIGTAAYERDLPALLSFDAPYAIVFDEVGQNAMPHGGTVEAAAIALGKRAFSSEIGGSGRVTPESMNVAETGVVNLLRHLGAMKGSSPQPSASRSALLALTRAENYPEISERGHLVPEIWLGATVAAGQRLGSVYRLDRPGSTPYEILSACDGTVVAAASRCIVEPGEPAFMVAEPISR